MGYFKTTLWNMDEYYEGDQIKTDHFYVTNRPTILHIYSGTIWLQDLDLTKASKIDETWQEAITRMGQFAFAMGTDAIADLIIRMYQADQIPLPTAGSDMAKCVDIFQYFKTKETAINAMTTVAQVEAYDPVNDAGWPY